MTPAEKVLKKYDKETYGYYKVNFFGTDITYEEFLEQIYLLDDPAYHAETLKGLTEEETGSLNDYFFKKEELATIILNKKLEEEEEKFESDPDLAREALQVQAQCYLMENLSSIVGANFDSEYANFTILHDKSDIITNMIAGPTNIEPFWSLTPEQFARFHPKVRIYKSYYEGNSETHVVEMPFEEYMDESTLDNITESSISRGAGVGLAGVEWVLQGTNPAESKNVIEVKLKFRFDSLQELAKPRVVRSMGGGTKKVAFLDFFVAPSKNVCGNTNEYNINYYTFKMTIGWNALDGMFEPARKEEENLLSKCIREDTKTYTLTMTTHDMEIEQNGVVRLTLNAFARIDVASYTDDSNVFRQFLVKTDFAKIQNQIDQENIQKKCREKDASRLTAKNATEEFEKKMEELQKQLATQKTIIWTGFLKELSNRNKMWAVKVPKEALGYVRSRKTQQYGIVKPTDATEKIITGGPVTVYSYEGLSHFPVPGGTDIERSVEAINDAAGEKVKKILEEVVDNIIIPFMFLGDILEIALDSLSPIYNPILYDKNMKIFVGDVIFYNPVEKARYSINMADIPISLEVFKEWFVQFVYAKQRVIYPVKEFITDFMENVIYELFKPGGCFLNVPKRRLKVAYNSFSFPTVDEGKDSLNPNGKKRMMVDEVHKNKKYALDNPSPPDMTRYYQYMLIYGADVESYNFVADYERDLKIGIPWIHLGRDRGLVKSVSFARTDLPYLRESRISQGDTTFAKLRERYTATIKMIGNNIFYPGSYVFINPSTMTLGSVQNSSELARTIGLVGYYMVTNTSSEIGPGSFETTVNALWVAGGFKEDENAEKCSDRCGFDQPGDKKSKDAILEVKDYQNIVLAPLLLVTGMEDDFNKAVDKVMDWVSSNEKLQAAKKLFNNSLLQKVFEGI